MLSKKNSRNPPSRRSVLPPVNLCSCPGCRQHVARLEELLAQFSRENDRLRREAERRKAA